MQFRCNIFSFIVLQLLVSVTCFAQTGPAGVGTSASNRFWMDAARLTNANASSVQTWTNFGGNALSPTQGTSANRPTFYTNILNGYPAILFDNTNDRLMIADNTDLNNTTNWIQRTFFVVFRTGSDVTGRRIIFEEGGGIRGLNLYLFNGNIYAGAWNVNNDGAGSPWSFASTNTTVATNTSYIVAFVYNGNNSVTGTISLYLNGINFGTINNVGRLYPHNEMMIGAKESDTYYETGSSSGTGEYFNGYMAEFIHYDYNVNSAQLIIIQNYLAAKYGLTLGANDIYVQDNVANGNYDHEMAGIGRVNSTNINSSAQGTGIVRILNPTGLDDNEFLLFGHDNGSLQATNLSDIPVGVQGRMARTWRTNVVSASGTSVNVGSVDLQFDLSGLGSITASDLRLLVDVNNNGVFTDDTPISGASLVSGSIYQFTAVATITNNVRFSLGTINKFQTPLPIELLSFNAKIYKENSVKVDWKTATEKNNSHFEVQRSINGVDWEILAKLEGSRNSSKANEYYFIDDYPYNLKSYYRLKQVDMDGSSKEYPLVVIDLENVFKNELLLYPNPTKAFITLQGDAAELSDFALFDITGRTIDLNSIIERINAYKIILNLSSLKDGVYFLKSKSAVKKIVKSIE